MDFRVRGMSCASCAMRVESLVSELLGVEHAQVNLVAESLNVQGNADFDKQAVLAAVQAAGYEIMEKAQEEEGEQAKREEQERQVMKRSMLFLAVFTLPLLYISMGSMLGLPNLWTADDAPQAFVLVQLLLTLPILYLGRGFYQRGIRNLLQAHANMDSLIALGAGTAFVASFSNACRVWLGEEHLAHHLYFESVAVIISLVFLGKYLEKRAKGQTSRALEKLMNLLPQTAHLVRDGQVLEVALEDLRQGDTIRVLAGERMPVDGRVLVGQTYVDESMMTGESQPVAKAVGDSIISGTVNQLGVIDYEATRVGKDTIMAQIVALVERAQGSKAPIAALADRISRVFVPVVLALALISSLFWYFFMGQNLDFSLSIFVAVLVIACPCALGLATPTAIMVATGRGAELGILVKSAESLEKLAQVDTMVLDKTGTLTKGQPTLTDMESFGEFSKLEILQLAASSEQNSEHPLAQALLEKLEKQKLPLISVENFQVLAGRGLSAKVGGHEVLLGNEKLMMEHALDGSRAAGLAHVWSEEGKTVLFLALDGQLAGIFAVADSIKESSPAAIATLQNRGLEVIMLTGDQERTASAMACQAGISRVIAEVLPDQKAKVIENLKREGRTVAMVGDGINDAPALVTADVGLAIGAGADIALEAADLVLMHSDLLDVPKVYQLSQRTLRTIRENLFWAFIYNLLGLPLAMGLFHLWGGPLLNPMFAALAMSLSSLSVVLNALRLYRIKS